MRVGKAVPEGSECTAKRSGCYFGARRTLFSVEAESACPRPGSAPSLPQDWGQVTQPVCASVSTRVQGGKITVPMGSPCSSEEKREPFLHKAPVS